MERFNTGGTTYFVHGKEQSFSVLSGIHGSESDIIPFVRNCLDVRSENLPGFLYIPEASPSAVSLNTRENVNGKDLNREFFDKPRDKEVEAVENIVKGRRVKLCISFHEDSEQKDFYLYDSGDLRGTKIWEKFKEKIAEIGVGLMNGIDDKEDPSLGYEFVDGYRSFPPGKNSKYSEDGTLWVWAMNNKVVERFLNPEIPGSISLEKKKKLVELFFDEIIIPLLHV